MTVFAHMTNRLIPRTRRWGCAIVLACAVFTPVADAQTATADSLLLGSQPAPFWAISVGSLDRELAWYRDVLGFTVFSQGTEPTRKIRFALLRQGAALVELLQIPTARSLSDAVPGLSDASQLHGFFKGGMVVTDVAELERRLKARGVPLAFPLGTPPGGPYRVFGVRDPEGNLLQFFGT